MVDKELESLKKQLAELEKENNLIEEKEKIKEKIERLKKGKAPDTTLKRMGRGFKYMLGAVSSGYKKVANSDYVQSIHEDREKADPNAFFPDELKEQPSNVKKKEEPDEFVTDLTNIRTDL